jgi:hypothetical protein
MSVLFHDTFQARIVRSRSVLLAAPALPACLPSLASGSLSSLPFIRCFGHHVPVRRNHGTHDACIHGDFTIKTGIRTRLAFSVIGP